MLKKFKKLYIPLVLFFVVLVTVLVYVLSPKSPPLSVITTSPENGTSFSPFFPVVITFNRDVLPKEIKVTIAPDTNVSIVSSGKIIQIVPKTKFVPETQYTITVGTNPLYVFAFTTQRSAENSPEWNQLFDESVQQYEQQNATQDAALKDIRSRVPINENGFVINYSYATNTYTVALSQPHDQNKTTFWGWLKQKGVTSPTSLRIKFVNQ